MNALPPTHKSAVAYYRVSSQKQGQSGLGLEAQEASVTAYATYAKLNIAATFTEVESATKKGQRTEIFKAIDFCKKNSAVLLIAKIDRLARNVAFISNLMDSGVDFVAIDMPEANRLTIHIMAAMAEHEATMISKRTKDALQAAKARGTTLGKPENLTKEAQEKSARVNEAKAIEAYKSVSAFASELRGQGLAYLKIAERLNSAGFTTRNGAKFTATTVKRMLDRLEA
jgi:DNA invertase Pin-like site-specific DNA recombinase